MSEENVELVRRALMAWQAGAIGELDALLAPDVEWRPTPLSGAGAIVYRGPEGVHEWISEVISRRGEVRNEIHEMRDLGDRVLVLGHVVELIDAETRTDAELAWIFRVYDERIVSGEGYVSRDDALRAAGPTE